MLETVVEAKMMRVEADRSQRARPPPSPSAVTGPQLAPQARPTIDLGPRRPMEPEDKKLDERWAAAHINDQ